MSVALRKSRANPDEVLGDEAKLCISHAHQRLVFWPQDNDRVMAIALTQQPLQWIEAIKTALENKSLFWVFDGENYCGRVCQNISRDGYSLVISFPRYPHDRLQHAEWRTNLSQKEITGLLEMLMQLPTPLADALTD